MYILERKKRVHFPCDERKRNETCGE